MENRFRALIVEDELELRKSVVSQLNAGLGGFQFECVEAVNGKEAVEQVTNGSFDFVLMDVRMPEMNGIDALKHIKDIDPRIFVLIMTAHANTSDAVQAIKLGAYDYLEKPVEPGKLQQLLTAAIETRKLVSSLAINRPILDEDIDTEFVGSSKKMTAIYDLINRLSQVETTVLIRGENGTGKELVANAIHQSSPHKHGPFVAINCGAIAENLMESELFGHEKGAFTGAHERKIGLFQTANMGTIFLDEIAELKPDMQVKLLRVLQEKRFIPVGGNREIRTNARVIAATNQNLEKMMEDGTFREDLYYRLNVMPIFMPPLRERLEDLPELVDFFLEKFSDEHHRKMSVATPEVLNAFRTYAWPGNIRELENVIERAFIVETSAELRFENLPDQIKISRDQSGGFSVKSHYKGPMDFDQFKEQTEKEFIINALKTNQGKINKTVALANIPKNTLLRKIKKYGINVKDFFNESQKM